MSDAVVEILIRAKSTVDKVVRKVAKDLGAAERAAKKLAGVDLDKFTSDIKKAQRASNLLGKTLEKTAKRAKKAAISFKSLAIVGATGLGLKTVVQAAADFETGLVNVSKTTNLAGAELQTFGADIQKLSRVVPETTDKLFDIAQLAGQLGIEGSTNLLKFTETIGKMSSAIDGVDATTAATQMARILKVTKGSIEEVDRYASALVNLGNNMAANEGEILGFANFLGQSTAFAKASTKEVFALAGAMKSLGARAESTSSTFSRALSEIDSALSLGGDSLNRFASVAGLSLQEFTDIAEKSTVQAMIKVVEGMKRLDDEGTAMSLTIKSLGLLNVEAVKTFGTMANNLDTVRRSFGLVNDGYELNLALNTEFFKKQKTFNAQWQIFKSTLSNVAVSIGKEILPSLLELMKAIQEFLLIEIKEGTFDGLGKGIVSVAKLVISTLKLIADNITLITVALSVLFGGYIFSKGADFLSLFTKGTRAGRLLEITMKSLGATTVSAFRLMTKVASVFFGLIRAHPIIAVILAVAAAIAAIIRYTDAQEELRKVEDSLAKIRKKANDEYSATPYIGDVEIKSAKELAALTKEQNAQYKKDLFENLKYLGKKLTYLTAHGQESKKEEERMKAINTAMEDSVMHGKVLVKTAAETANELEDQRKAALGVQGVYNETVTSVRALYEAQRDATSIRYDAQEAALDILLQKRLLIAAVSKDTNKEEQAYAQHYSRLADMAGRNAKDMERIALDEIARTTAIKLAEVTGNETEIADKKKAIMVNAQIKLSKLLGDIVQREQERTYSLRKTAFNRYSALVNESASLAQKISDLELNKQSTLADLRRKGMNDYQAYTSKQREIASLTSKYKAALEVGDYERAASLISRQKQLASSLDKEVKVGDSVRISSKKALNNAIRATNAAMTREIEITKLQKKEVDIAKEKQLELYQSLDDTLTRLNTTLERMAGKSLAMDMTIRAPSNARIHDEWVTAKTAMANAAAKDEGVSIKVKATADTTSAVIALADMEAVVEGEAEIDAYIRANYDLMEFMDRVRAIEAELEGTGIKVNLLPGGKLMELAKASIAQEALDKDVVFKAKTEEVDAAIDYLKLTTTSIHQVSPNARAAVRAIENLQRTTYSTHIIKVVEQRAVGGLIGSRVQNFARGGIPNFARGLLHGPGTDTSDSIFARLSRGEFVIKAAAVRKYGADLFHSLNQMMMPGRYPAYAGGGSVTTNNISKGSGMVAATSNRDAVDLNLNINGEPMGKLTGSRGSVSALVTALKDLERGGMG